MVVELMCRYIKPPSQEAVKKMEEDYKLRELMGEDITHTPANISGLMEYEYGPFVFDTKDIISFNMVDSKHTCVRFVDNMIFTFRIGYKEFKAIYIGCTGVQISSFTDDKSLKETLYGG
jgi:hypothetical protein